MMFRLGLGRFGPHSSSDQFIQLKGLNNFFFLYAMEVLVLLQCFFCDASLFELFVFLCCFGQKINWHDLQVLYVEHT